MNLKYFIMAFILYCAFLNRTMAEPYIALKTGSDCGACHINRTGGGMRTEYGSFFGRQSLPSQPFEKPDLLFNGKLGPGIGLGADLRNSNTVRFEEHKESTNEFLISEFNLYLNADIVPEYLVLYVDERFAPGGTFNRETFALLKIRDSETYIKTGRFFVPFGLRLQDDETAIRKYTGFDFNSSDYGIEFGTRPGPFALTLAITNGTAGGSENNNGKQYSLLLSYIRQQFRFSVSALENDLQGTDSRSAGGVFCGVQAGPAGILAEWDLLRDKLTNGITYSNVSHLEIDWTVRPGIILRAWAGRFDPDRDLSGDSLNQTGAGIDWNVVSGLQVRSLYRRRNGPDFTQGSRDDEALLELHVYF